MELKWAIAFSVLVLTGCQREQWDDCITSAGPMRSEERIVGDFTTVDLRERIDLVLEERTGGTIEVEAGRNLLDQVRAEVRDGVLYLDNNNTCKWVRSYKPRITVKVPIATVDHLVLRGTGNITCSDTIVREAFQVEQWGGQGSTTLTVDVSEIDIGMHTGAGDVRLHGRCRSLAKLYSGIMAPIDASDMRTRFVQVNNSSISDMRCWPTEALSATISGVGDVYYQGSPTNLESTVTGSGSLIRVE